MTHYDTLGVSKNASTEEIKKAYRRLASKHHPDKGGDKHKFQEIEEAYRVLSNPQTRAEYDNPAPNFGGFGGGGQPDIEDILRGFGGFGPFGTMFGDGFAQHRHHQRRNRTINLETVITLEEAFHGKEMVASITLPSGKEQVVNIKIPAGITDNTTLRLSGMGDDSIPHLPRGDVHLTVKLSHHTQFAREGDDLIMEKTLPVWSAILGDKFNVTTIDHRTLEINVPAGTQHDQFLSVQGAGMPNMRDARFKGRLLIRLKFTIPNDLTEEQKNLIRATIS